MDFNKALLNEIGENLINSNETISIAESVTAGLLQLAFSEMSNSKLFFMGGITLNTPDKVAKMLRVDTSEIKNCNCVSSSVSETMANRTAEMFETEWSIATSGYCTPERSSAYEVYAYYSILYKGDVVFSDKLQPNDKTDSLHIKLSYAEQILQKFLGHLELRRFMKHETNSAEF